jgi:hypothetical protein
VIFRTVPPQVLCASCGYSMLPDRVEPKQDFMMWTCNYYGCDLRGKTFKQQLPTIEMEGV